MTRSEIIAHVAETLPKLGFSQIQKVVPEIFEEIMSSVNKGNRVEFRGFGTFHARNNNPRLGRNPKTGEIVTIPAKKRLAFKAGKELRDKMNSRTKA